MEQQYKPLSYLMELPLLAAEIQSHGFSFFQGLFKSVSYTHLTLPTIYSV